MITYLDIVGFKNLVVQIVTMIPFSDNKESSPSPSAAWETLVLFAVNFTKLNVHMNMGNVMGNVR